MVVRAEQFFFGVIEDTATTIIRGEHAHEHEREEMLVRLGSGAPAPVSLMEPLSPEIKKALVVGTFTKDGFRVDEVVATLSEHQATPARQTIVTCLPMFLDEQPAMAMATGPSFSLSSLPQLSSNPGAPITFFLDFDGSAAETWGSFSVPEQPAYNTDGNANAFSTTELANITEIWERVVEKYSFMEVNVTTVDPGSYPNGVAVRALISGGGSWLGATAGGVAYIGSFVNSSPNTVYAFEDNLGNGNPKYVAEATAHEIGHALGLRHQSSYSGTTRTAEYNPGTSAKAPIMGNSYSATRGLWWNGPNEISSSSIQQDLLAILDSGNGTELVADDAGDIVTGAVPLVVSGSSATLPFDVGVVSSTSDVDIYSVALPNGSVSIYAEPASAGGMLDLSLALLDQSGSVVATSTSSSLSEFISPVVSSGDYFIRISSAGSYGDIGQYTVTVSAAAPLPVSDATPTATPTPPPTPTPTVTPTITPIVTPSPTPTPHPTLTLRRPTTMTSVRIGRPLRFELDLPSSASSTHFYVAGRKVASFQGAKSSYRYRNTSRIKPGARDVRVSVRLSNGASLSRRTRVTFRY